LKLLWHASVAPPGSGPLKAAWDARLAPAITPPVAAGGRVFVAGAEMGELKAFDIATGKPAWTVTLGARIDSAPTILDNLCVVGSHDGWVYAFVTETGDLAWRARVAPVEQRMVVNGRVESTWPAVGSVLFHDGKLWATAGRGTETDGGVAVVQLEPATGKTLWAGVIGPGPRRRIGLLSVPPTGNKKTLDDPVLEMLQKQRIALGNGSVLRAYLGRFGMRGFSGSAGGRAVAGEYTVVAVASSGGNEVRLLKKGTKDALAIHKLDAAPVTDAVAIADGKALVALESGKLVCLGDE
jgi:hypothetical protein